MEPQWRTRNPASLHLIRRDGSIGNSSLVGLYWHIGERIREDVLGYKRAEYGQQIVSALSTQLTFEYERG
jgi:DUF1016 N-terminal domain